MPPISVVVAGAARDVLDAGDRSEARCRPGRQVHRDAGGRTGIAQRIGAAQQIGGDGFHTCDRAAFELRKRCAVEDDIERVAAARADDVERVAVRTAIDRVGTVAKVVSEGVIADTAADDVAASAADQRVVARSAANDVAAAAGIDGVVAALPVDDVDAAVDRDAVAALAAEEVRDARQRVGASLGTGRGRGGDDRAGGSGRQVISIDAGAASVGVVAVADARNEPVVAGSAVQRVSTNPAVQCVSTAISVQRIVAGAAIERVVAAVAIDGVGEVVAGAGEIAGAVEGQGLDVGRKRVGVEGGLHHVRTLARILDHLVAGIVDAVGIVAGVARHRVGTGTTDERVVARAADEDIVAGKAGDGVITALTPDLVRTGGADQDVACVVAEDQVTDHVGRGRGDGLDGVAVVGEGHPTRSLRPTWLWVRDKQLVGAVAEVVAGIGPGDAVGRLLPLEGEEAACDGVGGAVGIDDGGCERNQRLTFGRRRIGERRPGGRGIVDVVNRRRGRREHGLQHAVGILVDRHDAQRLPGDGLRHRKGRAGRAHQLSPDVVVENGGKSARARILLDLPEVADGSGDRPVGLSGVTLSASVTPAIDTVRVWPSGGVSSSIVNTPTGSSLTPGTRTTA